jgi:hypothetical protein
VSVVNPRPAGAADHFALTQLLTDTARRVDSERADTVWELFTEGRGDAPRRKGAARRSGTPLH